MEQQDRLLKERDELNALINKGFKFEVACHEVKTEKRLLGLIRRRSIVEVKREYKVSQPTLGTLDRLSAEWIEIAIDDEAIKGDKDHGMAKARTLVKSHAMRCARIIAIAVIGSEYLIPVRRGNAVAYREDNARLESLTRLFAERVKPSELFRLVTLVGAMCNLGDFLNSIRLMQTERTTAPNLVERDRQG